MPTETLCSEAWLLGLIAWLLADRIASSPPRRFVGGCRPDGVGIGCSEATADTLWAAPAWYSGTRSSRRGRWTATPTLTGRGALEHKSPPGGVILLGSYFLKTYSITQPTVSLSSGNAEF